MICPRTDKECENRAGCTLVGECNKPVPIIISADQIPENQARVKALVDQFIADVKAGKINP